MNAAVRAQVSQSPRVSSPRRRHPSSVARDVQPKREEVVEATIETTSKLVIHALLGCVALASLATLIPIAQENSGKLKELTQELQATQNRVGYLQARFGYYFDPQKARSIHQEVSNQVSAQEAPVIFIQPD